MGALTSSSILPALMARPGGMGGGGEGAGEGALEQTTAVASSLVHRCGLAEVTHARTLPANTPSDAKWA